MYSNKYVLKTHRDLVLCGHLALNPQPDLLYVSLILLSEQLRLMRLSHAWLHGSCALPLELHSLDIAMPASTAFLVQLPITVH